MPDPNIIVSRRINLETPPERAAEQLLRSSEEVSVELDEGRRVRLDPADARSPGFAQVLDGLSKLGRPVYLEVEPETAAIARLLIPYVARVVAMRPTGEGYEVELDDSHARHQLRSGRPDYEEMLARLRRSLDGKAPVIVTDDDAQQIVDVRPFDRGPGDERLPPFREPDFRPERRGIGYALRWIWCWRIWPWWWFGCITSVHAQQVFDAMGATTCNPLTVPPPCIPFLFPDDGCWGRAHEMCRLMIASGHSPRKVWITGKLHVATRNNPSCFVGWGWHVAPTLCVRSSWFRFWSNRMVIDPSLFTTPVTEAVWKSVQGDPAAILTDTDWTYFRIWGETDPTYAKTNIVLADYRLALQNRSNQQGPPPYANCP